MLEPTAVFDIGQLKFELLQKIEPGRLAEAEKTAETQGISLTEALASSLILDFADLGECCSKVTGLPYVPLLPQPPSDVALRLMSPQCASSWETFPVRYDPGDHMLWLAIHDPDQIQKLERIFRFFMQPQQLGFTIAPDVEIARACHKHLGVFSRADRASVPRRRAQDEPMLPSSKPNAESEKRLTKRGESKRTQRSKETKRLEPPYEEMYRSLVSAITLLVRREHEDSPEGIHEVRTRVRYCQLLAGRRNLNRVQTDGLVLAAWILGMKDGLNVSRQVVTPYNLEGILLSDDRTDARAQEHRVETQILSLVQAHEDLRNQGGLHGRDVTKVRRALQLSWSAAPKLQDLLEAFLQILIDDEFLEKMGGSDGCILILDPEEESTGNLGPSLVRVGYNAVSVSDCQMAMEKLEVFSPDLVIIEMSHAPDMSLRLCESLTGSDGSAPVPVLALVPAGNDQLATQSLRAGAHDFLRTPVNMELLLLKIQTCLVGDGSTTHGSGVTGTLDEMTFTDMIQILCAGQKDLEICLTHAKAEAYVYVRSGEVIHARIGDLEGEDAFYELMRWNEGRFATRRCTKFPERSIKSSAMSLLMEGARQVDELDVVAD